MTKCLYKHNVWWVDRVARLTIWVALIAYGAYTGNYWFLLWIIPLLTWIISFCPFYPLLKLSTFKWEEKQEEVKEVEIQQEEDKAEIKEEVKTEVEEDIKEEK